MITQNLIPMAGAGIRFQREEYKDPKPLVPVNNIPMVIQATRTLPAADRWIFLCRTEHIMNYPLNKTLIKEYPGAIIQSVDYLTDGQASTCLLAEPYLDKEMPLVIGACDNGMTWNRDNYAVLMNDPTVDAIVWTFRNNATVQRNPKMYGWVRVTPENMVQGISCKVPLSDMPTKDHAIVGTFTFKKAKFFIDGAKSLITKNHRINNEFYVDMVMDELVSTGLRVKVFEVEKYICFGTPNDLRTYEYWRSYFFNHHRCAA